MNRITINGRTIEVEGNNISMINGDVYVDGVKIDVNGGHPLTGEVRIKFEGAVANLRVDRGSAIIEGNVDGDVSAGSSVTCGHVLRNVNAGSSVHCQNVGGNVGAGSSVTCGDVGGDVDAGSSVRCRSQNNQTVINADIVGGLRQLFRLD